MDKLDFFTVDLDYVDYLKKAEFEKRGFSRVPNMDYSDERKQKFLCGVVLKIDTICYFVPVSSYKLKKPDNFLIKAKNGNTVSSLRFNYMFPIPISLVKRRTISDISDEAYRALLSQELQFCIKNQETILNLANRTYKRVLLGKDVGLVNNSCDFKLLEEKCKEYENNKISCLSPKKTKNECSTRPSVKSTLDEIKHNSNQVKQEHKNNKIR